MSLYDPRPPVDLAGDRTLWSRLVDRTTSTDLHDWDGANPHHRPFALGADLVFLSAAALGHTAAEVAAGILRDGRAEAVVVTDGARGSAVYRRAESPLRIPAVSLPGRPVVDTNGAGDAYAAAYLYSWLAGASHADAARAGAVAGAWA